MARQLAESSPPESKTTAFLVISNMILLKIKNYTKANRRECMLHGKVMLAKQDINFNKIIRPAFRPRVFYEAALACARAICRAAPSLPIRPPLIG